MSYKYCPNCGSNKIHMEGENLIVCKNCNFHLYFNPRPTTGVIFLNDRDEVMLVERNRAPKKGWWDLPGGFIDLDETLEQSVYRELREELKIKSPSLKLFNTYTGHYLYKGINYPTLCFIFVGKLDKVLYYSKEEINQIKFFPKDKIPLEKIAFIDNRKALKDFIKKV